MVADVLRSGWLGLGPKTQEFEQKFAEYTGAPHCVGLNSCTSAIHLALRLLDLEEGSTVNVERDSEPARIKVVGNTAGAPPYRGVLRHRGWEVSRLTLPPLPATGRAVVAPAEVEVA